MHTQCPECRHPFQAIDVDGVMSERKLINEVLEESREVNRLRAEIERTNDYWREIHDQQNALMVRLYNHGYMAGHQDSVASTFVLIHHTDMDSYHADVVAEILEGNAQAQAPKPAPQDS